MKTLLLGLTSAAALALGTSTASAQYPVYPAPAPVYPAPVYPPPVVYSPAVPVGGYGVTVGGPILSIGLGGGHYGGYYRPYYAPRPYYGPAYYHGGYYHRR